MEYKINCIEIENFKSYSSLQRIQMSDLSVFLGANSSGKSTALQALLLLKQTMECNNRDIELLLSGQYVALGDFGDIIYDKNKASFSIGIAFKCTEKNETSDNKDSYSIHWYFDRSDNHPQAELAKIVIEYENKCVELIRDSIRQFRFVLDGELSPVFFSISNLCFDEEVFLKYDVKFNCLFAEFLNAILSLVGGKKARKIAMTNLVSINVTREFYLPMFRETSENKNYTGTDHQMEILIDQLVDLIDEFSLFQNPFGDGYIISFPKDIKKGVLCAKLCEVNYKQLQEIYEKYRTLFKDYLKIDKNNYVQGFGGAEELSRNQIGKLFGEGDLGETCQWIFRFYEAFEKTLSKLYFVGPIREQPKGLYNLGFEQDPKYVGSTGSNFASVLLHENKTRKYMLPDDEVDETTLWEALNEWAAHLNIASAVSVSQATSFGLNVSVSDTQNKTADIMNVGIGTSQVLPVLITGLLSDYDETLVFEQPELHLHPFSQSRLVDFFIALAKHGRKVIVETHSEAFILRLRYQVLRGNYDKDAVAISFFQNKQGTKVAACNISGYGNISYPEDFRDETQELLNDLLNAALNKEKK